MTIYFKIKELIDNTDKLSVSRLEKELGFGSGTIRRWQKNDPGLEKVLKVADYFNVSIGELISHDEPRKTDHLMYQIEHKFNEVADTEKEHLIADTIEFLDYQIKLINEKTTEE